MPLRPGAAVQLLLLFGAAASAAGASGSAPRPYPPSFAAFVDPSDSNLKEDGWSCPACTFVNTALSVQCEMCAWKCRDPASPEEAGWTCNACTFRNKDHSVQCAMCTADAPGALVLRRLCQCK